MKVVGTRDKEEAVATGAVMFSPMPLSRGDVVLLLECMELAQHHYAGEDDLDNGYRDLHARLTRELGLRTAVD
jgi:hypothetical protein